MPTPRLRIVDADAPNGFGTGRPRACTVCLTTGALALPHNELAALCEHCVASVANRATPLACAAADLVLVAEVCTKAIWALSAFLLVSSIVGVPADVVAMTTLAIVLLVVATKPLLAIADRAIRRLLSLGRPLGRPRYGARHESTERTGAPVARRRRRRADRGEPLADRAPLVRSRHPPSGDPRATTRGR